MDPTTRTVPVLLLRIRKQPFAMLAPEPEVLVQVQVELQEEVVLALLQEPVTVAITVIQVVVVVVGPVGRSMDRMGLQATVKEAECLHWDQRKEREAIARHLPPNDHRSFFI